MISRISKIPNKIPARVRECTKTDKRVLKLYRKTVVTTIATVKNNENESAYHTGYQDLVESHNDWESGISPGHGHMDPYTQQ